MPGKRAEGKAFIGWWAPVELKKRLKAYTGQHPPTDTDVLNEALSGFLDQHAPETTDTTEEQQWKA